MTTEEQDYKNYLMALPGAITRANSFDNVINGNPSMTTEEQDYFIYRNNLPNSQEREEADYRIFSVMFELIDIALHEDHEQAFDAMGYSLLMKCKRKKSPEN